MKLSRRILASVLVWTSLFAYPAFAELDYELRAGGSYSDNIRRTASAEEEEVIAVGGLNLGWSAETRRFLADLQGDFEFRKYMDDTFDSDNVSQANLGLEYRAIPDVFHWVLEDDYGTLTQDPFRAETPENRENVNRFSTGPDVQLRLGRRTQAEMEGRYSISQFGESDADSETRQGRLSLVRSISPTRNISINMSGERVEFDETDGTTGFDRYSAYLGFESRISRGSLSLNLGANEIHDGGEDFGGTLIGVAWDRQLSPVSRIGVSYDQRYSDSGELFARLGGSVAGSPNVSDVVPVADPLENRRLSLSYSYSRNAVGYGISVFVNEDDYQERTDFDSERLGGSVNVDFGLGDGWRFGVQASYEDRQFDTIDRNDEYLRAGLRAERRLSRTFWLSLQYDHEDRSSNESGQEYRENRVTLLLRFSPTD